MEKNYLKAEKQLIRIWKCGMILSWLTIFIGICCWVGAGKEILEAVYSTGVGWLVLGMINILIGGFGIRISKKKNENLNEAKYVVRHKKGIFILGIITYCLTILLLFVTIIFSQLGYKEFYYMVCCTSGMMFFSFWYLAMYRQQKLIVKEDKVIIYNICGKPKVINRREINQILSGQDHIRFIFVDKNNEKLFRISINMVDAADFIQDTLVKLQNEHRLKVM